MKKLQKILSIVTVVSVFCVNMAFAAEESPDAEKSNPSVRVTNNLTTGDIRFHIEESYDEQGKNAYDTSKPRIVVPGQKVNKYVHIVNDAEKAWLRVKVDFDTENDSIDMDEFMLSVADGWEKIGDYWYYKYPADEPDGVEKGGKVLFLNGFSIPSSLGDEVVDGKFELNFQVEAVQTAHFTPDWTSDIDPWNGTIIEYCEHTDSYTLKGTNDAPLTIEYRGGSQGLVRMVDGVDNADDFFSNWARFMPGDTFTGTFNVQNKTAKSVTIYFHTEVGNISEESEEIPEPTVDAIPTEPPLSAEEKLLSTCSLKITSDDGAVIFDGPMSTVLDHPIAIGQFTKDTEKQFAFEVSIPAWLPNAYSLREAQTVWIFETAHSDEFTLPDTGGSGNVLIYPIMAAVGIIAFIAFKRRFKQ